MMIQAFVGGLLIGSAVLLLLLLNGRVAGVSGILSASLGRGIERWRLGFLAGLLGGGLLLWVFAPWTVVVETDRGWPAILAAGGLVGFGTVLGGGCTSGHGVCGVSRLSKRSMFSTTIFMLAGIATARFLCAS